MARVQENLGTTAAERQTFQKFAAAGDNRGSG